MDYKNDVSTLFYIAKARFELKIESAIYDPNKAYNLFEQFM